MTKRSTAKANAEKRHLTSNSAAESASHPCHAAKACDNNTKTIPNNIVVLVVQLVSRHSCVADRLPVVVRFPAGPRVRLKTVDPLKGNGLGQKKNNSKQHGALTKIRNHALLRPSTSNLLRDPPFRWTCKSIAVCKLRQFWQKLQQSHFRGKHKDLIYKWHPSTFALKKVCTAAVNFSRLVCL